MGQPDGSQVRVLGSAGGAELRVLRWGWSAYETPADLALEERGARALGLDWAVHTEADPPLDGVDALVVTSGVAVDAAVLARFGGSLVLTTTSGVDHVDLPAAVDQGVIVARLPLARRDPVVEHAVGALVGLMRRWPALQERAVDGAWARGALPELAPRGLAGARVAVVGLGVIGARMAQVLDAIGASVVGVDPAGGPPGVEVRELSDALDGADAVTLHCALTSTSRGLMSAARLDALGRGAVVVNTARGPVLDVEAAVDGVRTGHLAGLAVDVFPEEPYPRLAAGAAVPGVWFTPHAAGFTRDLGQKVARGVVEALGAWVAGDAVPHQVGR